MKKNSKVIAALATVAMGASLINRKKRIHNTPNQSAAKEVFTVSTIANASIFDGNIDPNFAKNLPAKVGDYYLDTEASIMYKLALYGQKSVWTPIIFFKRFVAETVGAIGPQEPANSLQRLDENTVIELNQDIKSETDNVPLIKFLSDRMIVFKRLSVQELVDNFSEFVMSAFDGLGEKQLFRLKARNDDGDSIIEFHGNNISAEHKFAQYDGVGKLFSFFGSGLRVPNQATDEIAANTQAQENAGTFVYNSTTGVLRLSTGTGWVDVLLNGPRLVLGGTDNLTDRLQVNGTSKFAGRISITGIPDYTPIITANKLNIFSYGNRMMIQARESAGGIHFGGINDITSVMQVSSGANNGVYIGAGGNVPNKSQPSANLELYSKTQGFLLARQTTAEINAISSPANGLQVYNTDLNTICFYNGTSWQKVTSTAM